MIRKFLVITILLIPIACFNMLTAQEANQQGGLDAEALKKANDPMADTKAFNVHNYIISSIYGAPDAGINQLLFRYAQPIGKILLRGTLPVVTVASPDVSPESGLGDFNMFAVYSVDKGGNKFGIGPLVVAPTATGDQFGQGKWQVGVAVLAFLAKSHIFQGGTLLQWQTSIAGDSDRTDVSLLTAQLFGMWQLGGGTYLRSTGIWSFDLEGSNFNIPIGLGVGKVLKVGSVVFNIFAEPQFSVLAKGTGQTKFQTFVGFNTQF